jgi:hypothetical protein
MLFGCSSASLQQEALLILLWLRRLRDRYLEVTQGAHKGTELADCPAKKGKKQAGPFFFQASVLLCLPLSAAMTEVDI